MIFGQHFKIPAIVLRSGRGLQIINFGIPTGEQETESRWDDHLLCTYTVHTLRY